MPQTAYLEIKALNQQSLVKNPCLGAKTACAPFLKYCKGLETQDEFLRVNSASEMTLRKIFKRFSEKKFSNEN